jgi:lysophospholipase L1-like esterase
MANEHELSYTAEEIDERLGLAGSSVLFTEQTLTEEQKAQVRANIGVMLEEDEDGTVTKEVEFTYDGDQTSDKHTWVNNTSGSKAFVKVADIPDGVINLVGGYVSVINSTNTALNYSFEITKDMLEASVNHSGWIIPAKVSGLQQVYYQHTPTNDVSLIAVVIICTRPGQYEISFNGWGEVLAFNETGIYFMDNRDYGGGKYAASLVCTVTSSSEETEVDPVEYKGNEVQMFTRGICIGDSITEGVFNHNDGEVVIKKYSYPSVLKRLTGVEVVNAGIAGLTSKTWYAASLNSATQYGKWVNGEWSWHESPQVGESDVVRTDMDYSGFDFAVIHLGINDIGMMGSATLEETITTFETNINNIINKLKTESSGIKVFLATIIPCYATPGNTAYETLNTKIREIANATEDVYLIDLNMYSACFDGTPYENQHLTALGYHKMASEISAYISYIISQNLEDFKWVQFIGTTYTA